MTRKEPVPITREFNPGNAFWCEEHGCAECTKRKHGGGRCHKRAIRGTDACNIHAGIKKDVAKAKGDAKITAWSAIGMDGASIDYRMAVLGVLQMSWLRLAAYSDLLRRQVTEEQPQPDPESLAGQDLEISKGDGLIGYRYGAAGKDGNIFAQSEEVRALVNLEAAERDRVVKYAKTAHDMGISDRLTSMAERWGDVVAMRITLLLEELSLSPEQQARVPVLIQAHLGSIDVNTMGGENT